MLRNVLGHRYTHWRESRPHSMLHLSSRFKLSMGRVEIKYFLAYYGVIRRRTFRRSRELVDDKLIKSSKGFTLPGSSVLFKSAGIYPFINQGFTLLSVIYSFILFIPGRPIMIFML